MSAQTGEAAYAACSFTGLDILLATTSTARRLSSPKFERRTVPSTLTKSPFAMPCKSSIHSPNATTGEVGGAVTLRVTIRCDRRLKVARAVLGCLDLRAYDVAVNRDLIHHLLHLLAVNRRRFDEGYPRASNGKRKGSSTTRPATPLEFGAARTV